MKLSWQNALTLSACLTTLILSGCATSPGGRPELATHIPDACEKLAASTLLQIGLLLFAYLPPAVSRFLTRNVFAPNQSRDNSAETPQALLSRVHLLYPSLRPVRRPETLQSRLCSREPERHSHGPIQDASGGQRGACPLPSSRTFINGAEAQKAMGS